MLQKARTERHTSAADRVLSQRTCRLFNRSTMGKMAAMIASTAPIVSHVPSVCAHDPAPANRAAAAVQTMGIAASRRTCGADRVALSSTFRNHASARFSGFFVSAGAIGSGKPFRNSSSGSSSNSFSAILVVDFYFSRNTLNPNDRLSDSLREGNNILRAAQSLRGFSIPKREKQPASLDRFNAAFVITFLARLIAGGDFNRGGSCQDRLRSRPIRLVKVLTKFLHWQWQEDAKRNLQLNAAFGK